MPHDTPERRKQLAMRVFWLVIAGGTIFYQLTGGSQLTASVFGGSNFNVVSGLIEAGRQLSGSGVETTLTVRELIVQIIVVVLDFVTLIGLVSVIIAGLYLIVSNGDEGQKDKAKKIILYTIIGIVVIVFSRVIVTFFGNIATFQSSGTVTTGPAF